jgi:polyphosphate kinase
VAAPAAPEESFAAGAVAPGRPVDGEPARRYLNRELSTLDFNGRVLALAENVEMPLLERVKFLAIFATNMDEFFQVRVAGLKDQLDAGIGTAPDGLSVSDQLRSIRTGTESLLNRRLRTFLSEIVPALTEAGIDLVDWAGLAADERSWTGKVFAERIFPVLTPLAVDPGHPFPYISNLSLNLAVIVRDPSGGERRFARVKIPPLLPGLLGLPGGRRFVALEQVIAAHLGDLFPGMEIESHHPFRVTRNADLTLEEEEADDLLVAVEMELRRRRFGRAVRLEVDRSMTEEVRILLVRELDLAAEDVYESAGLLDHTALWQLFQLDRPDLKDDPFVPVMPARLGPDAEESDIFAAIRQGDLLIQHPYESFSDTIEDFVAQASRDPHVLAIKHTLYRTSGDSAIVRSLIRAAERGKQVAALVELKARGDEAANIGFARALEQAGVHVVYGLVGLKTHSKVALVVRQEGAGITRYCHIGTGNYNASTARTYEDISVLTARSEIGADLTDLFNYLTGYSRREDYRKLLVAPAALRSRTVELIEAEVARGKQGRIIWKLNNLVDTRIIDALYAASQAGVRIDLIVRAICCLRPGVPGLSENIRVRSIVGRWLEHSRVYYFGDGSAAEDLSGGRFFIGSPDMMDRNLDRRVETLLPLESEGMQARISEILSLLLSDDVRAWALNDDGSWQKVPTTANVDAQQSFQDLAIARSRRRRREAEPVVVRTGGAGR